MKYKRQIAKMPNIPKQRIIITDVRRSHNQLMGMAQNGLPMDENAMAAQEQIDMEQNQQQEQYEENDGQMDGSAQQPIEDVPEEETNADQTAGGVQEEADQQQPEGGETAQ